MPKARRRHHAGEVTRFAPQGTWTTHRTKPTREQHLGSHIEPDPTTGCWLWNGQTNKAGQQREVYTVLVGPIPARHRLRHTCGTSGCVNPAHLTPTPPATR